MLLLSWPSVQICLVGVGFGVREGPSNVVLGCISAACLCAMLYLVGSLVSEPIHSADVASMAGACMIVWLTSLFACNWQNSGRVVLHSWVGGCCLYQRL